MKIKAIHMLRAILGTILCLLCAACVSDDWGSNNGGNAPGGKLVLTLRVPGIAAAGGPATRGITAADESLLQQENVHLLLFQEQDGNMIFHRYAPFERLTDVGGNPRRYTLDVPILAGEQNGKYCLMVVTSITKAHLQAVGGGEDFPNFANNGQDGMESVRRLINYTNPGDDSGRWPIAAGTFKAFPMWGESASFVARPGGDIGVISLARAVARIDVGINFVRNDDQTYPLDDMRSAGVWKDGEGKSFMLTSVSLYKAPRSGYVASAAANWDAEHLIAIKATAMGDANNALPRRYTIDDLSFPTDAFEGIDRDNKRSLTRSLYVPEAVNHGASKEQAVCLVVGGIYGDDVNPTYYRIDIYDRTRDENGNLLKPTPESRLDILRNHAYVVNITSVSGPGANNEDDALKADNTLMELEITRWNQDDQLGDITTDGVYYLKISKNEQEYYSDGSPVNFTIDTNYDGEMGKGWQMEADQGAKEYVVFYDTNGNEMDYQAPNWPANGGKGVTELRIGMKEFAQPTGTTDIQTRDAMLTFTSGRMKTRLRLGQTTREVLKINFTPEELNFSQAPQRAQAVGIQVTTRKAYTLRATWKGGADGTTDYTWVVNDPTANPPTFPDNRFLATDFFVEQADGTYLLKPQATTGSRAFTFTFTATTEDGKQGINQLNVYQSEQDVDWYVADGTGKFANEVAVANDATKLDARIVTKPTTLPWYFSRGANMGQVDWITNLNSIIGAKQEGSKTITFNLVRNPNLGRRTYTLQARSTYDGFIENTSTLILIQKGIPLILIPKVTGNPGAITANIGIDGKTTYTRNYGTGLGSITEQMDVTANTNWYWWWDRSSPVFDRQMREMFGNTFKSLYAINRPTTDGPADGKTEKTWLNSFGMTTTEQALKSDEELQLNPTSIPLGGERTLIMELRNKNAQLEPVDAEAEGKKLVLKRMMPSYQNIVKWPYTEGANLDLYSDDIGAGGGEPFEVRTNATGTITYLSGSSMETLAPRKQTTVTATGGYDTFSKNLQSLGCPVGEDSWKYAKTYAQLKYSGKRRMTSDPNGPDQEYTVVRNYIYGTDIKKPTRNMEGTQRMLSNGAHTLNFDFGTSTYKKLKVRVKTELVNTCYDIRGVTQNTKYVNAGGENGDLLTWPNSRLIVNLPANDTQNLLRKVIVEYWSQNDEGVEKWSADKTPIIYQDATPYNNRYIVKYDAYSPNIHSTTWLTKPFNQYEFKNNDQYVTWIAASPLQKDDILNKTGAASDIAAAKNNSTALSALNYVEDLPTTINVNPIYTYATMKYRVEQVGPKPIIIDPLTVGITCTYHPPTYGTLNSKWTYVANIALTSHTFGGSLRYTTAYDGSFQDKVTLKCNVCGVENYAETRVVSCREQVYTPGGSIEFQPITVIYDDNGNYRSVSLPLKMSANEPAPPAVRYPVTTATTNETLYEEQ